MNEIVTKAIEDFETAEAAFTKFIAPNDTDATGSHQAGIYIKKNAWNLFFDKPGRKGELKDVYITIRWQDDFETSSRFVYYGSKDEYRITQFGRGFPFLSEESVGDLLIIYKYAGGFYKAYVLSSDDDIETFLSSTGIGITETNKLFHKQFPITPEDALTYYIKQFVATDIAVFPSSRLISKQAESIFLKAHKVNQSVAVKAPDQTLVNWVDTEYLLFKALENKLSGEIIKHGFQTVDELILMANSLVNRRKVRAGKALENHLSSIFDINQIKYETQVKTEGNKKPDFIFPDGRAYHDAMFKIDNLFFLAAKTTCKDRWRQILNEADRIKTKHLVTLQQGISKNQLQEMKQHHVVLVVPKPYKKAFPEEFRNDILSIDEFMFLVKKTRE